MQLVMHVYSHKIAFYDIILYYSYIVLFEVMNDMQITKTSRLIIIVILSKRCACSLLCQKASFFTQNDVRFRSIRRWIIWNESNTRECNFEDVEDGNESEMHYDLSKEDDHELSHILRRILNQQMATNEVSRRV